EGGTVIVGTLTGSSATSTSLTGKTAVANLIGTIGDFTGTTGFTLNDGHDLTVAGALSGGPTVAITGSGTFGVAGSGVVAAIAVSVTNICAMSIAVLSNGTTIALKAASTDIPGVVTDGGGGAGGGTLSLTTTSGAITEGGTVIVGTLTGSSATSTSLTGKTAVANLIGTIGDFTGTTGFTLNDGHDLTVAGALSGGPTVAITGSGTFGVAGSGAVTATSVSVTNTGAMSIAGLVNGTTIALKAASIDIPGVVTDAARRAGGRTLSLTTTSGAITEGGTVIVGTL